MKECSQVEKLLYLYLDGELDPAGKVEVEQHILGCQKCSNLLDEERRFLSLIENGSLREPCPEALKVKIEKLLEKKRRPFFHIFTNNPRKFAVASAITAVLLFCGVTYWNGRETVPPFVKASVDGHIKYLNGDLSLEIISDDPSVVFTWLKERMMNMPELPVLNDNNIVLVGGRISTFGKEVMALINYEVEHKPVTLVIIPESAQAFVETENHTYLHGRRFNFTHTGGLNTVSWKDDGNNFTLVSSLHSQEIKSCVVCHAKGSGLVDISKLLSI